MPRSALPFAATLGLAAAMLAPGSSHAACAITLSAPTDGAEAVQSPTFSWTSTGCQTSYRLQLATDAAFSTSVYMGAWTVGTSQALTESTWDVQQASVWPLGTIVYWKAQGRDSPGGTIRNSGTRILSMDPDLDDDGSSQGDGDCDDSDASVYPGAPESCDLWDEDCDGVADDGLAVSTYYVDGDFDGFGDSEADVALCGLFAGMAVVGGDCDTDDATIYPGAPEACDGQDNDCDGITDDGLTLAPWYPDGDNDGYGRETGFVMACAPPEGYVATNDDCEDNRPLVHPGATEDCSNGLDDDCDGVTDTGPGCRLAGTLTPGDADAWVSVSQRGMAVAEGIGEAGDVDGDGVGDLLLPLVDTYDGGQGNRVTGYRGPVGSDRLSRSTFRILADDSVTDFGRQAVAAGDINGDGQGDLFVTATDDDTGTNRGIVYLFLGPLAGTLNLGHADATFHGWYDYDQASTVHPLGDMDGDGYDDFVISTYTGSDPFLGAYVGWADLWYGPVAGDYLLGESDESFYGLYEGGNANSQVTYGDMDGDGVKDLVSLGQEGAWFCYGPNPQGGALDDVCDYTSEVVGNPNTGTARNLEAADLNGDGWADLVWSSRICRGPFESAASLADCLGYSSQFDCDSFNGGHTAIGDLDADGYLDLVVAEPGFDDDCTGDLEYRGAVLAFYGPLDLNGVQFALDEPDLRIDGGNVGVACGYNLGVSDVNGDGRDDISFTCPGYSGPKGSAGLLAAYFGR